MPKQPIAAAALVEKLLAYALNCHLITRADLDFCRNGLLSLLQLDQPEAPPTGAAMPLPELLEALAQNAVDRGLIGPSAHLRTNFETTLMGLLTPSPTAVQTAFSAEYHEKGAEAATAYLYQLGQQTNYIRMADISKNLFWQTKTSCGQLDITVNLSRPERDPKEIEQLKSHPQSGYPACMLCTANVGFPGDLARPARHNLRIVPYDQRDSVFSDGDAQTNGTSDDAQTALDAKDTWLLQYSPYLYYSEHCILLCDRHIPMNVTRQTLARLLNFVTLYPHYFMGCNAGLPVVGGSILNHDHFQGGRADFPMDNPPVRKCYTHDAFPGVQGSTPHWPLPLLRLTGPDCAQVLNAADVFMANWKQYSDPDFGVFAFTGDTPHNAITPIARRRGEAFELDMVLRNNRKNDQYPDGIFHPHPELHHIKKENIGLIEVMGRFILPGRLAGNLPQMANALCDADLSAHAAAWQDDHPLFIHRTWLLNLQSALGVMPNDAAALDAVQDGIGQVCARTLADCGVFPDTTQGHAAMDQFLKTAGWFG